MEGGDTSGNPAVYVYVFSINEWSPIVKVYRSAVKRLKGNKDG